MPRILREQSLGVGGLWITGEEGNGCLELLGPELEGDWELLNLLSSRDRCVRGLDSSVFRRQLGAGLVSLWRMEAGIPRSQVGLGQGYLGLWLGGGRVGIHPNGMGSLGVWGLLPAHWGPR